MSFVGNTKISLRLKQDDLYKKDKQYSRQLTRWKYLEDEEYYALQNEYQQFWERNQRLLFNVYYQRYYRHHVGGKPGRILFSIYFMYFPIKNKAWYQSERYFHESLGLHCRRLRGAGSLKSIIDISGLSSNKSEVQYEV